MCGRYCVGSREPLQALSGDMRSDMHWEVHSGRKQMGCGQRLEAGRPARSWYLGRGQGGQGL